MHFYSMHMVTVKQSQLPVVLYVIQIVTKVIQKYFQNAVGQVLRGTRREGNPLMRHSIRRNSSRPHTDDIFLLQRGAKNPLPGSVIRVLTHSLTWPRQTRVTADQLDKVSCQTGLTGLCTKPSLRWRAPFFNFFFLSPFFLQTSYSSIIKPQ